MKLFRVTMKEKGSDHEFIRNARAENERQVMNWYGLEEDDIEYYRIEEING